MRFLLLNIDYPAFLESLYQQHPGLADESYAAQMARRNESLFGVADFYSKNLQQLGHEAHDIHANNAALQRAWMREKGLESRLPWAKSAPTEFLHRAARAIIRRIPPRFLSSRQWDRQFYVTLAAQIEHFQPDVILNFDLSIETEFLRGLKQHYRFLIAQVASPLPHYQDFAGYDLMLSSLPNLVSHFRGMGLEARVYRLGFEPAVLSVFEDQPRSIPVSFVGSFSPAHQTRIRLFEFLCQHQEIALWGALDPQTPANSPLRRRHQGARWGKEMYQILHSSKLTLNHHIDMAGNFANNMRLYEATGMGALLITDWKENLHNMFEPEKEVVTYRTADECLEKIRYYLAHEDEAAAIAQAGQQRTLRDHSYARRMEELVEIIGGYL